MKELISKLNFQHITGMPTSIVPSLEAILREAYDEIVDTQKVFGGELIIRIPCDEKADLTYGLVPYPGDHPKSIKRPIDGMKPQKNHVFMVLQPQEPDGQIFKTFKFPIDCILSGMSFEIIKRHTVYVHNLNIGSDELMYCGVTKRGWLRRWREHIQAASSGSVYRFHSALRQWLNNSEPSEITHSLIGWGLSEDSAYDLEEAFVGAHTLYPHGLNMIPGGKSGIAYCQRKGIINGNERVSPDDMHLAIRKYFERSSVVGGSNPLIAALWNDNDYAERIICGPVGRLKPNQIREARFLSDIGLDVPAIAQKIGAANDNQIKRLLSGQTYSRIAA